jgi:hypothetical protein
MAMRKNGGHPSFKDSSGICDNDFFNDGGDNAFSRFSDFQMGEIN